MPKHKLLSRSLFALVATCTLALSLSQSAHAEVINFESFLGPSLFGGPLQNLSVVTSIGTVKITGGTVLTAETNLPADTTSVYGSIGLADGSLPYLDPITITFPVPVTNFFLNVYNGNTTNVDYTVADNAGHSQTFNLTDNFSSGQSLIGIPATGNIVTIFAKPVQADPIWDFSIDNITFNERLPPTPEPATLAMFGTGLILFATIALKRRRASLKNS